MPLRWVRRVGLGMAGTLAVCLLIAATLWWRLSSGPISLDMITPWLTAAIAENLGNQFRVEVGGTVLERDEHGRAAMRIRDIKVRDRDGTVIASAPKAEVGLSSASLFFTGSLRANRLNLVGAELAIRVESDGRVSVSTGSEQRPLVSAEPRPPAIPAADPALGADKRSLQESFAAFLGWLDSLGALGLDGGELTEIGLKSGNLVVDDLRNGHQSKFEPKPPRDRRCPPFALSGFSPSQASESAKHWHGFLPFRSRRSTASCSSSISSRNYFDSRNFGLRVTLMR